MSDRNPVGDYSAEEIHTLLQRIRTEQPSAQNASRAAGNSSTTAGAKSSAASNTAKKQRSDSELGVTQELSVEELLNKIRREIAEEGPGAEADNQSSWTTTVHRPQGR